MRSSKMVCSLSVLEGVHAGSVYPLEAPEIVIGRDADCGIVLPVATVSRQHARVYVRGEGVFLEDLRSLNGTRVNGRRIEEPVRLEYGDLVQIHDTVLVFRSTVEPVEDPAANPTEHGTPGASSNAEAKTPRESHREAEPEIKLRAILDIMSRAGTSAEIDDVLAKILESLFSAFPQATRGYVLLVEGDWKRLVPRAVRFRDLDQSGSSTIAPIDLRLAHRVISEAEAQLSNNEEGSGSDVRQTVLDESQRSILCAPLTVPPAEPLGVIQIECDGGSGAFVPQDVDVLSSVALFSGQLVASARWHERRRNEIVLQQEHAATARERRRLRAVLDVLPVGVFICDARGKLLETNPEAVALWGETPLCGSWEEYAEHYKAWWSETGERLESHEFGLARALESGQPSSAEEIRIEAADGRQSTVLSYALPIHDSDERIVGGVAVFVDITLRKAAEEALKQADRRKDEFLAMLAHELRNPLAPIRNALTLLTTQRLDSGTVEWAMNMMERQVEHLVRLVDDLLDVSRATQGKIKLRKDRLQLKQVIDHAVETARPLVEHQRHTLEVSIAPEPIWVEGDEIRLAQVVANLLNNASKYTDAGGRIWLSASSEDGMAVVRVRDTGIGITPEVLPHVFDLFTQADRSLDRAHGGLGIGLSLVHKLIELHGGSVEAHSEGPGRGSQFIVRLPLAAPAAARAPQPSAAEPTAAHRVLVVDDNVDAATTLAMMFRLWGHDVRVAHDGFTALQMALEWHPELVLLDIGLPGKSGYEVAEQLRSQPDFGETLLVAITGYGQEDDRNRSRAAGFDVHLVKPVDSSRLRELLASSKLRRHEEAGLCEPA